MLLESDARFCPRAARAFSKGQRALRAFARWNFSGNGRRGHWILGGRAGKTGHGHALPLTLLVKADTSDYCLK